MRLGSDEALRRDTRARILANNHRLYAPRTARDVIGEWEAFLRYANASPRPEPSASALDARALVARELHSESPERAPIVARPIEVSFGTDLSAAGRRGADWRRLLRARRCLSEDRARRLENRSGRG